MGGTEHSAVSVQVRGTAMSCMIFTDVIILDFEEISEHGQKKCEPGHIFILTFCANLASGQERID
jgi:hypothetical protein